MPSCIVPRCSTCSTGDERKKSKFQKNVEKHYHLSFHKLPKDEKRRSIWLQSLQISEPSSKSAVVCSLHFKEQDFNRTLSKTFLRENAVPSYYPFDDIGVMDEEKKNNTFKDKAQTESEVSDLDTPLSSIDTQLTKRLKNNFMSNVCTETHVEKENYCMRNEVILNEKTGDLIHKIHLIPDNNRMPFRETNSEDVSMKMHCSDSLQLVDHCHSAQSMTTRATSVSPEHFIDDKEKIRQLEAIIKKNAERECMQKKALINLKRKLARRERQIADLKDVINTLKKKKLLQKNELESLENIDGSNQDLLTRIIDKSNGKSVSGQYTPELQENRSGNCLPLENISVLHVTSVVKKPVDIINSTTPSAKHLSTESMESTETASRWNALNFCVEDHSYTKDPRTLSFYAENIISYIAGCVVKSLKCKIKCETCYKALSDFHNKKSNLIETKNRESLVYPSDDVIFISTKVERTIRHALFESGGKFLLKKFTDHYLANVIMSQLLGIDSLFLSLKDHDYEQNFLETHSVYLIRAIVDEYLDIRLHYINSNADDESITDRQMFTNLVQHKQQ